MTDAIQASSTLPLPAYQTVQGSHDPLPTSSPQALNKSLDARATSHETTVQDDFKSYLDRTSVTLVEKLQSKNEIDTAQLISGNSVYTTPDALRPI